MRKAAKAFIATFCSGILVCGIGVGVAFAEFTSLEYSGMHHYGMEDAVEVEEVVEAPSDDGKVLIDDLAWSGVHSWSFSYDEAVPENTIVFDIRYNPEYTDYDFHQPSIEHYAGYYDGVDEGEYDLAITLYAYTFRSEAASFFEVVEPFLAELREGKFGDYSYEGFSMEIRASSALEGRVDFLSTFTYGGMAG